MNVRALPSFGLVTLRAQLLAVTLLFAAAGVFAQEGPAQLAGIWQGALELPAGQRLRLVVEFNDEGGALTGTMDSVDQGARDLPIDSIQLENGSLVFTMRAIGGRYEGELAASGDELVGTWSQGAGNLPLTLRRDANLPVLARPQEPARPLPYREEEVAYESAPGVRLAATLTLPQGGGPFPAVVLITGSGPQDRDEAIVGHRPFYVLADALTRRGIAVLRADDRGVRGSMGNFAAATTEDFATDALAGVRYLAARADIRDDAIGLVGHSEGGVVAPLAATRAAPEARAVRFLVLLAGPGVPLGDILTEQQRLILGVQGAPAAMIDANERVLERLIAIALEESDPDRAAAAMDAALTDFIATLPEGVRPAVRAQMQAQVQQMNSAWMRWMLTYDPQPTLRALEIPVLALFGERDLQVPPRQNRAPLEAALRAAGHPATQVVVLPGLNHLFQAASTGAPSEYAMIEETMNEAALELVGRWIVERTTAAP
jgi:pimeloyl-ACP methyl ester carboxylesterase